MDVINERHKLPAKHVGSFLVLIFLATFRPSAIWYNSSISLVAISIVLIGALLPYKIYATIGFNNFWCKYKKELLLLLAYFAVCFLSLYLNRNRYDNISELINQGAIYIVITMSLPALIFLFSLPQNKSTLSLSCFSYSCYLPWAYFSLLACIAIWQYIDFEAAKSVGRFFVSSEVWPTKNINGLFRISTDLAPIFAIFIIIVVRFKLNFELAKTNNFFTTIVVILVFTSGLLVGSRVFYLILGISIFLCLVQMKISLRKKVAWLIFTIIFSHLVLMFANEHVILKLQNHLPYIGPLYNGVPLSLGDFFIRLSLAATDRAEIWLMALKSIAQAPFFGVSNGAFRLNNAEFSNTHNIILQILITSGAVGLSLLSFLFYKINNKLPVVVTGSILTSLFVDYPIDHSLPYIICLSYIVVIFASLKGKEERKLRYTEIQSRYIYIVSGVLFLFISFIYFQRNYFLAHQSYEARLLKQLKSRTFFQEPILIEDKLLIAKDSKSGDLKLDKNEFNLLNDNVTHCHYPYLKSSFVAMANTNWLTLSERKDCINVTSQLNLLEEPNNWLTNVPVRKLSTVWYFVKEVRFYSPVVLVNNGELILDFIAKGNLVHDEVAILNWDFIVNDEIAETNEIRVEQNEFKNYNFTIKNEESRLGYFVITLLNPTYDKTSNKYRRIFIKPDSIRVKLK
ncbi:O-antigen ligase family protein [Litorilituus lipolyticus]|uniref:O-antigen ligase domain-containing protein n=1 Tax=Litorilituus lipolyticus TaxID=2491017 RepID=A0A502L513_9GAMM|nr:O-antigen ligase family protein [Litorilituus lipolyticus]TPH18962.1 O-antigen ligase domain-containing protein [Litorilituus lipolyticus]